MRLKRFRIKSLRVRTLWVNLIDLELNLWKKRWRVAIRIKINWLRYLKHKKWIKWIKALIMSRTMIKNWIKFYFRVKIKVKDLMTRVRMAPLPLVNRGEHLYVKKLMVMQNKTIPPIKMAMETTLRLTPQIRRIPNHKI